MVIILNGDKLLTDGRVTGRGTFGGIHAHENAVAQSIPTGATYTKVINFGGNNHSENVTPDYTNNKIILLKRGYYQVEGAFSMSCGTNNVTLFGSGFLGGVELDDIHFTRKIQTAGDVGAAGFTGTIMVTQQLSELDFRARHDNPGAINFTFSYMNINVKYSGEI